jgi:hypothetical protein
MPTASLSIQDCFTPDCTERPLATYPRRAHPVFWSCRLVSICEYYDVTNYVAGKKMFIKVSFADALVQDLAEIG